MGSNLMGMSGFLNSANFNSSGIVFSFDNKTKSISVPVLVLQKYRLPFSAESMIAIDGTGHLAFKERHCPHCLTKEKRWKNTLLLS
ncbi:MAG: hypothetical protein FJW61_07940 [Actinobacteria bacterium]|nr:hypothetical protein [Actinomycetota bacterium]